MLVFAYDGTLNGDWVAHYAVRFAANLRDRKLRLVHLYEELTRAAGCTSASRASPGSADSSASRSRSSSSARGNTDVAERLLALVPSGADAGGWHPRPTP